MSKLFFDHLVVFEKIETKIKKTTSSREEREELWALIDEVTTHKVLEKVLDKLPRVNHEEFLEIFHKCPHDEVTIFAYLQKKTGKNIEEDLKTDLISLEKDLLKLFH
jgi:hypothetical protein